MNGRRLYHSLRLMMLGGPRRRAAYLKKHKLFDAIGEDCAWGPGKMPIHPKLIRLHNHVVIHRTAVIVTHDMLNSFLKKARPDMDFGYRERLGCVEIMDDVYVGNRVTILPGVRIGKNCVISTGSVVTQDIPENSVVAGNPARVIGRFDIYCAMRSARKSEIEKFKSQELPDEIAKQLWERFDQKTQGDRGKRNDEYR